MNKSYFVAGILLAFLLGGAGMWAYQRYYAPAPNSVAENTPFPAPSFNGSNGMASSSAFKEMERMRRQMDQFFKQDDFFGKGGISGNFGSWLNTPGGGFGTKIKKGEDDKTVYYKIKIGDGDMSNVKVNVDGGYVSIDAKHKDKSKGAFAESSISESFPVPRGVNPNSAKIKKEGDSIVIRFDKVS